MVVTDDQPGSFEDPCAAAVVKGCAEVDHECVYFFLGLPGPLEYAIEEVAAVLRPNFGPKSTLFFGQVDFVGFLESSQNCAGQELRENLREH